MRAGRSYKNIDHMDKIKITKYFNYDVRFNGFISRDNLPKIRDGPYAINLDDKLTKGTHWVSICIDRNTALYFFCGELNIFPKKYRKKSKTNQSRTTYLEWNQMVLSFQILLWFFHRVCFEECIL